MQLYLVQFFIASVFIYILVLNAALIFIVEPKFLTKYYAHLPLYKNNKDALGAIFLILLFVSSFFLGMMSLLMKLFNQLLVF